MTQERARKLSRYFTTIPESCEKYGKKAVCRSAQGNNGSDTYTLEEIVFDEGVTRYDVTLNHNFMGLQKTASIKDGEIVEVAGFRDFPYPPVYGEETTTAYYTSELTQQEKELYAKQLFHGFASAMKNQ